MAGCRQGGLLAERVAGDENRYAGLWEKYLVFSEERTNLEFENEDYERYHDIQQ